MPGFYSFNSWLGFYPERGVAWYKKQQEMARQTQVWEENCSFWIGVYMVQCVVSPSKELYTLHKSGKDSLKACLIKIPSDDVYPLRVSVQLLVYNIIQMLGKGRANASV